MKRGGGDGWYFFMTGRLLRQVRIEQSCRRIDGITDAVGKWLCRRDHDDVLNQYSTQLAVLKTALTGPLTELREIVTQLADIQDTGQVYSACRANDVRAEVVRRVFTYFRAKFDQRDDEPLGRALRAADEVVWSCWTEPFRNAMRADPSLTPKPAPLPYIEPQYSPAAVPRDDPPADLTVERDDSVLMKYLERLPVPVLALPAVCADDPWWLVYIGHEVGHHLQFDLAPSWGLVKSFGELVETTSGKAGSRESAKWRTWAPEIFADICSVHSLGQAAVLGILQLELDEPGKMLVGKRKYPPPLVRLAILAAVARRLGLDLDAALDQAGLATLAALTRPDSGPDPAVTDAVVTAALAGPLAESGPLAKSGPFGDLFSWDASYFTPRGSVEYLRDGLRGRSELRVKRGIRSARLLTAAAMGAWTEVAAIENAADREAERQALSDRYFPAVLRGREEETRAEPPGTRPDLSTLPRDLTRLLVEKIREEPGD
jgi:hypothetical protein